jgi:hypothetical protein
VANNDYNSEFESSIQVRNNWFKFYTSLIKYLINKMLILRIWNEKTKYQRIKFHNF